MSIHRKDPKILDDWYAIAHNKAIDSGLKRKINHTKLKSYLLKEQCAFTTFEGEKEHVIKLIYNMLMGCENLCNCLRKEKITETVARNAGDFIVW